MTSPLLPGLVLDQFPTSTLRTAIVPLGNRGGFSGARLWRIETVAGALCLRASPELSITPDPLARIHALMRNAKDSGLAFVPAVFFTATQNTVVESQGHCWDLTEWMPGIADFHAHPSPARLRAACAALARLHLCWEMSGCSIGSCPAVARRLQTLGRWHKLLQRGWCPDFAAQPAPVAAVARRAWQVLPLQLPHLPALLERWTATPVRLHVCVCDVWHDHVLFQGDVVSGIVDYGASKIDSAAVDLARLLGSLVGDEEFAWRTGLAVYREMRELSPVEEELARVLDRTGTLLGLTNWLRWLYAEGRRYERPDHVASRMEQLVARVEKW